MLNWKVIKEGIEYAYSFREKGIKFGFYILSNGSICNERILMELEGWKKKLGCGLIFQISMDGCEQNHNETRKRKDGSSTFKQVVENAKLYKEVFPDLILRETIIPSRFAYLYEDYLTLSAIADNVSLTPILEGDWFSILPMATGVLSKIYDKYEEQLETNPRLHLSLIAGNILNHWREGKGYHGCHAGDQLIGITTEGDIYPCHRFIAYGKHKLGSLKEGISGKVEFHFVNNNCNRCGSFSCNRCYATNECLSGEATTTPTNGYCEFCAINQSLVDKRSDRIVEKCKTSLEPWSCYISPDKEKMAIGIGEERVFGNNVAQLLARAMTRLLREMNNLISVNKGVFDNQKKIIDLLEKRDK
jgi:uncharacterized protein